MWLNYLRYHLVRAGGLCFYSCEFYTPKQKQSIYVPYSTVFLIFDSQQTSHNKISSKEFQ